MSLIISGVYIVHWFLLLGLVYNRKAVSFKLTACVINLL
jgi:hypothetical protein